jgi:hypothetical protein
MSYFAREEVFNDPRLLERISRILAGKLELDWMELDIERVRCRPRDAKRGLTYADTNVGSYGWDAIPEKIRHNLSMAARGAVLPPGLPNVGYTINRKSEVWSENAPALFEESKSRCWAPAVRIPWSSLAQAPHSEEKERALAQLYTSLSSMAMCAQDVPLRWVWRINQELVELKSWLCCQTFDAARLADAFRKRALAGGSGLGRDVVELEDLLKGILESESYPRASASANLLLAALVQGLLQHLGARAANPADRVLAELALQDVSRSLAYGIGHLRSLLRERPHEAPGISGQLEEVENLAVGFLAAPEILGGLALVSAGDRAGAAQAVPAVARLYRSITIRHLERCQAAGLGDRQAESPLLGFVRALES